MYSSIGMIKHPQTHVLMLVFLCHIISVCFTFAQRVRPEMMCDERETMYKHNIMLHLPIFTAQCLAQLITLWLLPDMTQLHSTHAHYQYMSGTTEPRWVSGLHHSSCLSAPEQQIHSSVHHPGVTHVGTVGLISTSR